MSESFNQNERSSFKSMLKEDQDKFLRQKWDSNADNCRGQFSSFDAYSGWAMAELSGRIKKQA